VSEQSDEHHVAMHAFIQLLSHAAYLISLSRVSMQTPSRGCPSPPVPHAHPKTLEQSSATRPCAANVAAPGQGEEESRKVAAEIAHHIRDKALNLKENLLREAGGQAIGCEEEKEEEKEEETQNEQQLVGGMQSKGFKEVPTRGAWHGGNSSKSASLTSVHNSSRRSCRSCKRTTCSLSCTLRQSRPTLAKASGRGERRGGEGDDKVDARAPVVPLPSSSFRRAARSDFALSIALSGKIKAGEYPDLLSPYRQLSVCLFDAIFDPSDYNPSFCERQTAQHRLYVS
jgi:hypothetical protein